MISDYRALFKNPEMYFGFVQIAGWSGYDNIAAGALRDAQMTALS